MRKQVLRVLAIVALVLLVSACKQRASTPADTVLKHARIYTGNTNLPWAQAIAVREGKILAVGSDKAIATYQGPSTRVIDAEGRMVLPGFMDGHVHMTAGAAQLEAVSLSNAKTIGEFQKTIKDYAEAHPDKKWIQGMGWVYSVFGPGNLPDKQLVDGIPTNG